MDDGTLIVFDAVLKRPACVLLQACMGGNNHVVAELFDPKTWLIAPTPDMKLYRVSQEELGMLAQMVNHG